MKTDTILSSTLKLEEANKISSPELREISDNLKDSLPTQTHKKELETPLMEHTLDTTSFIHSTEVDDLEESPSLTTPRKTKWMKIWQRSTNLVS